MEGSQTTRGPWRNWSGNQHVDGVEIARPRSIAEVADVVRRTAAAGRRVRPIGSGHSFTAVGLPRSGGDVQVRLDHLTGIRSADLSTGRVTVEAGITLRALNAGLDRLGLALTNLGDIDAQTLAGALATGTHGTGARLGGLASQVRGVETVCADGSVLTATEDDDPDLLAAAQVGLGALGVVTAVTLQTVPAFALHAREGGDRLDAVLGTFDEHAEGTDHFEAYWFPHTRRMLTKHNRRVPLDGGLAPLSRVRAWWDDELLSNTVFGGLVGLGRRVPPLVPPLARVSAGALGDREFTDLSHRVFCSPRRVRFEEMEYAVPREHAAHVLRELVRTVERSRWRIAFPVELRVAAGDDAWLSTAHGRATAYVAVHTAPGAHDRGPYFAALERIAGEVGGRPHWGKLHGRDAATLAERYPRFADFVAVRDRLDPDGVFTNDHLARVLGR